MVSNVGFAVLVVMLSVARRQWICCRGMERGRDMEGDKRRKDREDLYRRESQMGSNLSTQTQCISVSTYTRGEVIYRDKILQI